MVNLCDAADFELAFLGRVGPHKNIGERADAILPVKLHDLFVAIAYVLNGGELNEHDLAPFRRNKIKDPEYIALTPSPRRYPIFIPVPVQ